MVHWLTLLLGFLAQGLFASRMLSQWVLSEKSRKVVTPVLFWQLSLLASFLMFLYGWIRLDFSIMFGQILTYFVYIRNMQLQGEWKKLNRPMRHLVYAFPFLVFIYSCNARASEQMLILNHNLIPQGLLIFGIVAQLLFTLRFVYQWFYSEKNGESILPLGFWILSLAGSTLILAYAVIRVDYVLLAGHTIGIIVYTRNIYFHFVESKIKASQN